MADGAGFDPPPSRPVSAGRGFGANQTAAPITTAANATAARIAGSRDARGGAGRPTGGRSRVVNESGSGSVSAAAGGSSSGGFAVRAVRAASISAADR